MEQPGILAQRFASNETPLPTMGDILLATASTIFSAANSP
jgi:hypothetical protein